ncbi:MAG TPA: ABC transporter ATP-binding protein [Candidatus Acidoferrales bacterium]|nr:ABC transporter ATP-binding protein [Candidatus Acidoferrales bacterium]
MTSPAVEVRDLGKTYRTLRGTAVSALDGVSLRVEPGTIFGLIGQNGAGKTTLIKILLGLGTPTAGVARLLGSSPRDPAARRRVGYLPEQMRLPDYFQAKNFLRYMGRLNGVDRAAMERRIPALLERVGLGDVRKPVKAYSKGMQQRLGLAQALVSDPEVLFLDEPTDGLDPLGRKDVRDLLVQLRSEGKTIFLNSHLLSEVELVCDRIVILNKGKVARAATPDEFTRGTGEYLVRVAVADDAARAAAAAVAGDRKAEWEQNTLRIAPRDRAQLNSLLDRLRSVPVEIEAVEPVRLSLEDFFLQVVSGEEP